MPGTVMIHGSDGEVMAPLTSGGTFYRGKHQTIAVDKVGPDEETPLAIREALVGMQIPIIFTGKGLRDQGVEIIPEDVVLSYACEVIKALREAGKNEAADALEAMAPTEFDMYGFEGGIYHLI